MSWYLNPCTYSSSFTASLLSCDTFATTLACAWISRNGFANSSFRAGASAFSSKMKQLRTAAHSSGESSLKKRLKRSSLRRSSSPVLISHATRALSWTTSASLMKPKRRRTRLRHLSSSSCIMEMAAVICFLRDFILSERATLSAYWL